ncbi:MAG: hypothetical protein ABIQ06_12445, partial [Caldimonas sp.]
LQRGKGGEAVGCVGKRLGVLNSGKIGTLILMAGGERTNGAARAEPLGDLRSSCFTLRVNELKNAHLTTTGWGWRR